MLGVVVVKNCNYSMKHRRSGGSKHISSCIIEMWRHIHNRSVKGQGMPCIDALGGVVVDIDEFEWCRI
jgi:hypothetical protein